MSPQLSKESLALLIQDFIEGERAGMTRLQKIFGHLPAIHETQWYCHSPKGIKPEPQKIIGPSLFHRATVVLLIAFSLVLWMALLSMILHGTSPLPVIMGGFLVVSGIIYTAICYGFFKKEYNYRIGIDKDGITVDETFFSWKDIAATCILWWPGGKGGTNYLVIFMNDRRIEKYNLFAFNISAVKMSSYIEYYKQQDAQQEMAQPV